MSGGSMEFFIGAGTSIDRYLVGKMQDAELDDLMKDVSELAHDLEWAEHGDYDMDTYYKTVSRFKEKWFNSDRNDRLKEYLDDEVANLYRRFGLDTKGLTMQVRAEIENPKKLDYSNTIIVLCDCVDEQHDQITDLQQKIKKLNEEIENLKSKAIWKIRSEKK